MKKTGIFKGFSSETVTFFSELKRNNDAGWFSARRETYDNHVVEPARRFIMAMGDLLKEHVPALIADPKVNKSLFRLHRDTRFSPDKTPFKTHLGIWLWEGEGPRMECPGFYFHLEPPNILLAAGMHVMADYLLDEFRQSVIHKNHGQRLEEAIEEVKAAGDYGIGEKRLSKVPRGYDKTHSRAEYLLYTGLDAAVEMPIPDELYGEKLPAFCLKYYLDMIPLHRWLCDMAERARARKGAAEMVRRSAVDI